MKRSEKKIWMFITMLIYLSNMAQNDHVKFLFLTGMLKNNTTNLNIIFNRIINKQEEQILQRNLTELSNFYSRYNRRN